VYLQVYKYASLAFIFIVFIFTVIFFFNFLKPNRRISSPSRGTPMSVFEFFKFVQRWAHPYRNKVYRGVQGILYDHLAPTLMMHGKGSENKNPLPPPHSLIFCLLHTHHRVHTYIECDRITTYISPIIAIYNTNLIPFKENSIVKTTITFIELYWKSSTDWRQWSELIRPHGRGVVSVCVALYIGTYSVIRMFASLLVSPSPPPLLPHVYLHPITERRSSSRPMALNYLPPLPHVVYRQTDIWEAQFLSLETPAQRLAYPSNLTIYRGGIIPPPSDYLPFKKLGW